MAGPPGLLCTSLGWLTGQLPAGFLSSSQNPCQYIQRFLFKFLIFCLFLGFCFCLFALLEDTFCPLSQVMMIPRNLCLFYPFNNTSFAPVPLTCKGRAVEAKVKGNALS